MKSIFISVQSQYAVNILNGSKTLELRKSVPKDIDKIIKEHGGIWVYMYVTKGKPYLQVFDDEIIKIYPKTPKYIVDNDWHGTTDTLNGKVVARWWFDGYNTLQNIDYQEAMSGQLYKAYGITPLQQFKLCLTYDEIKAYGNGKDLYAWHISKLEIFDKPMVLGEFISHKLVENVCGSEEKCYQDTTDYFIRKNQGLTRPSQSWQYIWVKEK